MAEQFYNEESTSASFAELLNFLKWCKKNLGTQPYIIGGWAVYAHVKNQKSLDIDVVFAEKRQMEKAMRLYYRENGFGEEELFDQQKHFVKEAATKAGPAEIRFDTFCFADKNTLLENSKIGIPWRLLSKNSAVMRINGSEAKMPNAELLLALKAKAWLDRMALLDARGIRIDAAERVRIKSKLLKDAQDIRDLLRLPQLGKARLSRILARTKFAAYFSRTMREIATEGENTAE